MKQYVIAPGWWHDLVPIIYGHECCDPGHAFGPYVRSHYLLHYILEGEGQFVKGDRIYDVKKGDIFVIEPGEVTTYRASTSNPWEYAWLGFRSSQRPECIAKPVLHQPPVRQIFTYIRDHVSRGRLDGKIFSLTYDLLWQLSRSEDKSDINPDGYAAYAKTFLENTYMRRISIQQIAESLHIDRRYLTMLFRQAYGIPPQRFLMELRLNKAREFLHMGYGAAESAAMAGFTDLSNFSRQYKACFGVSPGTDRK